MSPTRGGNISPLGQFHLDVFQFGGLLSPLSSHCRQTDRQTDRQQMLLELRKPLVSGHAVVHFARKCEVCAPPAATSVVASFPGQEVAVQIN